MSHSSVGKYFRFVGESYEIGGVSENRPKPVYAGDAKGNFAAEISKQNKKQTKVMLGDVIYVIDEFVVTHKFKPPSVTVTSVTHHYIQALAPCGLCWWSAPDGLHGFVEI